MRASLRVNILMFASLAAAPTGAAAAAPTILPRGPSLTATGTAPTPTTVRYDDTATEALQATTRTAPPLAGQPLPNDAASVQAALQSYDAALLLPIPVALLGGMLAVTGSITHTHRDLTADTGSGSNTAARLTGLPPSAATSRSIGLVYLPHFKEGAPRYVLTAQRHGTAADSPVREFSLAAKLAAADTPFPIKAHASDRADLWAGITWRAWPEPHGRHVWLPALGYHWASAAGWHVTAELPRTVTAGWQTPHALWDVYAQWQQSTAWATLATAFGTTHAATATTATLLGAKRRLGGPAPVAPAALAWFLAAECGQRAESAVYYTERGTRLASSRSQPALFVQITLGSSLPGFPAL